MAKKVNDEVDRLLAEDKRLVTVKDAVPEIEKVPTGIYTLDKMLCGGFPMGKMVELFGPPAGGKSAIALSTAVQAQKFGRVVWIDLEGAFNPEFAVRAGLDMEQIIFAQSESAEDVMSILDRLAETQGISLVVVDSVAGLVTNAEINGDYGDAHIGQLARLMSSSLPLLVRKTKSNDNPIIIVWINQIRDVISTQPFAPQSTTKGGKSLPFWSSNRMDIKRKTSRKVGEAVVGQTVRATLVKSRFAPPFQSAEFDILYESGISNALGIVETALKQKVLVQKGSWITDPETGETIAQGVMNAAKVFDENPQRLFELVESLS